MAIEPDQEPPALPVQVPCPWCKGDDENSLLLCRCVRACGVDDCPMAERDYEMQPVPQFVEQLRSLIGQTKLVGQTTVPGRLGRHRTDAEKVLRLVEDLHSKCSCAACGSGHNRGVCASCSDFWPCKTINVIRSANGSMDDDLTARWDSAEGLGLS